MGYSHLIIIPCHGIWTGSDIKDKEKAGDCQDQWLLAPFQREGQDHLCFKDHLLTGFKILKQDPSSILMPSGGKTKPEIELSEAESYLNLLKQVEGQDFESYGSRVVLEDYARDSFENVIFLICRFDEVAGTYPEKITIVGFEFKRSRFLNNHLAQALNYPLEKIEYIGNSPTPPSEVKEEYFKDLDQSEYRFAVKLFESDWYGVKDPLLKKKLGRNPFHQVVKYSTTNPVLKQFLEVLGDGSNKSNEEIKNILMNSCPWST